MYVCIHMYKCMYVYIVSGPRDFGQFYTCMYIVCIYISPYIYMDICLCVCMYVLTYL